MVSGSEPEREHRSQMVQLRTRVRTSAAEKRHAVSVIEDSALKGTGGDICYWITSLEWFAACWGPAFMTLGRR